MAGSLMAALRSAVLSKVRLPPVSISSTVQTAGGAACLTLLRGFAEGTYLDKNQVTERIVNVVKNFDKVEPTKVTPQSRFKEDLGLDSLDTVEVVMAFEEEFGIEIPDSEADKILSTEEAINFIASHPQAK